MNIRGSSSPLCVPAVCSRVLSSRRSVTLAGSGTAVAGFDRGAENDLQAAGASRAGRLRTSLGADCVRPGRCETARGRGRDDQGDEATAVRGRQIQLVQAHEACLPGGRLPAARARQGRRTFQRRQSAGAAPGREGHGGRRPGRRRCEGRALDAYSDWGFLYGPGEIEPGRSDGSALSYEVRESGVYVQLKFGQLVEADFRRTCRGGVPTSRGHAVGIGAFGGSTLDCTETLHLKFLKDEDVSLGEATREGARAACPSGSRASRKS